MLPRVDLLHAAKIGFQEKSYCCPGCAKHTGDINSTLLRSFIPCYVREGTILPLIEGDDIKVLWKLEKLVQENDRPVSLRSVPY